MYSKTGLTIVSALFGWALFVTANAQTAPKAAWPLDVATTPKAEACVKALMEEESNEAAVSASVGETFIACMQLADATNFYEFDRHKANGTILMNKPSPCLRKALASGAICVVAPTEKTETSKGKIVIASPNGIQALSLTIDTSGQNGPLRNEGDECKNAYGDRCGTTY